MKSQTNIEAIKNNLENITYNPITPDMYIIEETYLNDLYNEKMELYHHIQSAYNLEALEPIINFKNYDKGVIQISASLNDTPHQFTVEMDQLTRKLKVIN